MEEKLAYCGLICHTCAIYLATREKDQTKQHEMRAEIAREIKKHYGQECKAEDVGDCDGCCAEGRRLFSGSKNCHMRKCAREKHIENCTYCDEYSCQKLEELFATDPEARKRLDEIRNSL